MKTHPGVLATAPSKAQTNDSDVAEDPTSNSAKKIQGLQEEMQDVSEPAEKGGSRGPTPMDAGGDEASEPMETTA